MVLSTCEYLPIVINVDRQNIVRAEVRDVREGLGVLPTYKTVDTCSAEFAAETPYHYSTYEDESEVRPTTGPKVMILGSGPIVIVAFSMATLNDISKPNFGA